jgi:hypothetical protein
MPAGQGMHLGIVSVVRDEAGESVVGLELKGFALRHLEYDFITVIEGVFIDRCSFDQLHGGFLLARLVTKAGGPI